MAIRSLTYLDIPAARRRDSAARMLSKLRERHNDPSTTQEQAEKIRAQISRLEQWANGTIEGA